MSAAAAGDHAKAERWFKRERNAIKKYLDDQTAKQMPEWHRSGIQEYLAGKGNIGHATVALQYLANVESAAGCGRVLDGDDAGFAGVDRACLYNSWVIRLLTSAYDADTRPDRYPRLVMETVAPCWMHAIAIGAQSIATALAARVKLVDAGDGSIGGKELNRLCTLMAHYITGKSARDLKASGWASPGPYAPVVEGTLTPDGYQALADAHIANVGSGDSQAFFFYPYRIYPAEILAIEQLSGVAIGASKHPLLTSPLARRRTVPEIPMTEELAAIVDKAKQELPALT
jgi:hypothetical protein